MLHIMSPWQKISFLTNYNDIKIISSTPINRVRVKSLRGFDKTENGGDLSVWFWITLNGKLGSLRFVREKMYFSFADVEKK